MIVRLPRSVIQFSFDRRGPRLARFKLTGEHTIFEAIKRQRRKVLAGEDLAIKRMNGAWKAAYAGIQAKLDAVTAKIAAAQSAGEPISPAWLYQQDRWAEFLKAIDEEIAKYAQVAAAATVQNQAANVALGSQHAKELVVAAGVDGGFKTLPVAAFEDVVGMLTDKSPLFDLFAKLGPTAVQTARNVFAQEIAAGQHPYKIAKRFQDELGMTKRRAELIARTESIRAYTTATQRNYEANSDVVVASRVRSARDGRTCPLCLARDGMIIKHGEPFARHPACRCALTPVVKYLDVDRGTGEDWLKKQSDEYQEKLLGPSRYKLWKSGTITLHDLVQEVDHPRWGRGIRAKNLNQLGKEIAQGAVGTQPNKTAAGMGLVATADPKLYPPKPGSGPAAPPAAPAVPKPPVAPAAGQNAPPAPSAPQTTAQAAPPVFPVPTAKKANGYADELVQLVAQGKLAATPAEIAAAVNANFPKSTWNESHILGKLKKAGITPPATAPAPPVQPVVITQTTTPTGQMTTTVQTPADLAAKFPPPTPKATATDYVKALVKKSGDQMTPDEVAALVKHHFPKSTQTGDSVLQHYGSAGVTPKGGFPANWLYIPNQKSVPKNPTPKPTPPPVQAAAPAGVQIDQVIMAQQIGQQAGSNPGGLYLGADGKQRYVKFYSDPAQAYGEHLANEIYRLLGHEAPTSTLFEHNGQLTYASDILAVEGTVGQKGLTKAHAETILKGFAADILTGNWDAVGTGLDNVVILQGGGIARIDQGGTFLFRAKAGRKPIHVLKDIAEWDGFAPGGLNPYYAQVFQAAGRSSADDLGKDLVAQVKKIEALRKKLGGWDAFVKSRTPGLAPAEQALIAEMLEARTDLLIARAKTIGKPAKALKIPKGGVDPKAMTPRTLSDSEGAKKRQDLYGKAFQTFDSAGLYALASYKNGTYEKINHYVRGITKTLDAHLKADIAKIKGLFKKSVALDEDLMLFRGLGLKKWWDLDQSAIGTIIDDAAFLSTANRENFSKYWAEHYQRSDPQHPVLLRIRTARGTVAIPAKNPNGSDGEHEFIFDGGRFRILGQRKEPISGGRMLQILDVEMIETKEGDTKWNRKIK